MFCPLLILLECLLKEQVGDLLVALLHARELEMCPVSDCYCKEIDAVVLTC